MGEDEATTPCIAPSNAPDDEQVEEEQPHPEAEEDHTTDSAVYGITQASTPPPPSTTIGATTATVAAADAVVAANAAANAVSAPISSSIHLQSPSTFLPLKRSYAQVKDISLRPIMLHNNPTPSNKNTHIRPAGDTSESFRRAQEAAANEALHGLPKRRHSGVKRGTNFTGAEGLILAKAWVDLTERAPEDGANVFWEQVAEQFVRAGGAVRTASSLKIKWCELHRTAIKWLQARDQVLSVSEPSCSEEDVLAATMKLYREIGKSSENGEVKYPSNFKFVDAALFLKGSPAFSLKYLKNPKSTTSNEALPDVVEEVVASSQAERRRLLQNGNSPQHTSNGNIEADVKSSVGIEHHGENGERDRLFHKAYHKSSSRNEHDEILNSLHSLSESVNGLKSEFVESCKWFQKSVDKITKILLCQTLPDSASKDMLLTQLLKESFQPNDQSNDLDGSMMDLVSRQVTTTQRGMQQTDGGRSDSELPFHHGK